MTHCKRRSNKMARYTLYATTVLILAILSGNANGQVVIRGIVKNLAGDPITVEVPGITVTVLAEIRDAERRRVLFRTTGQFFTVATPTRRASEYEVGIGAADTNRFANNRQIDIFFQNPTRLSAE